MRRDELKESLRKETQGVHVSPALAQRAAMAARREEGQAVRVKKKASMAAAFALLAALLCGAALAAASRWGMLDFSRTHRRTYVPEDAGEHVEISHIEAENEMIRASVREIYYDGRTCRLTVDIAPKQEKTMFSGITVDMADPVFVAKGGAGTNEDPTVYEAFVQGGYERLALLKTWIQYGEDMAGGWWDYRTDEEGVMTRLVQMSFADHLPTRDIELRFSVVPYEMPVTMDSRPEEEKYVMMTIPITLTADTSDVEAYVNTEPVDYPSVGVRMDKVLVEVNAQELYVTMDYTVTDSDAFGRAGWLWFEFIDPNKKAENPQDQRLRSGMNYARYVKTVGPAHLRRQTQTLGRNEMREVYTLRAYDDHGGERFESQEIRLRPATADDLK